ncbi:MAG: NADP-dependent oxidoreductase [Xanthomonadales bacterium]|nr:NADP-dependent oxidoreductase [Xanthomonadales bacterium]
MNDAEKTTDPSAVNRQWTVAERPVRDLEHRHFGYRETPIPSPGEGEVLLRTHYLNVAPVMRMYMMAEGGGESTESVLQIGDVIHGRGVAEVIESRHPEVAVGEFLHGQIGWQTHKVTALAPREKFVRMRRRGVPAWYGLSALGMTGYSAWCGFVSRGEPSAGDAVLVSGAAGGVGSLVVQIAKARGCGPVVGIAGGPEKCRLVESLGADATIDYRADDVPARLAECFPDGMDIYFDNVGGELLEAALDRLAPRARVVLCGSISEYTRDEPFGPRNYTRLRKGDSDMRGFFVYNHADEFETAETEMAEWIRSGRLRGLVDFSDGFESLPEALMGLYTGANFGKRMVRVTPGEDPVW